MLKRLPLEGVTVIEMGHSVAAPYAGEILGDLGADVIKIEKTDGDDARKWAPPYWGEMSSTFQSLNRNKRSAIVNLKDPAERAALRKLIIERADVVIQNLRPGAAVDTSLYETALGWMCYHAANFQASGELPKRQGSGAAMIVPYRGYATKDGFIVIAAGNDKLFASLAKVLGHPEWIDDPRFLTNPDRVKHQEVLYQWIEDIVRERPSREWQAILDAAAVPNAPMQTIAEVLDHPQTKALGMMQQSPLGDISLLGLPISFDGARPGFRKGPPTLGEHTAEIFGAAATPLAAAKRA